MTFFTERTLLESFLVARLDSHKKSIFAPQGSFTEPFCIQFRAWNPDFRLIFLLTFVRNFRLRFWPYICHPIWSNIFLVSCEQTRKMTFNKQTNYFVLHHTSSRGMKGGREGHYKLNTNLQQPVTPKPLTKKFCNFWSGF